MSKIQNPLSRLNFSSPERAESPSSPSGRAPGAASPLDQFLAPRAPRLSLSPAAASAAPVRAGALGFDEVPISTEIDDPFVSPSLSEPLPISDFTVGADGKPVGLTGPKVAIAETSTIVDGNGRVLANNPWTAAKPNAAGNFLLPPEPRFPSLQITRGTGGRQTWTLPAQTHLGQTTAFQTANVVHDLAEQFAGRPISWGVNGKITINPHEFADLNAFYNPDDLGLHFGVVQYKAPGSNETRIFEMASSKEVVAHEAGHAIHDVLKPNHAPDDLGFGQWGESFGDQNAMWTSLQDPERVQRLLTETGGDFSKSNALSRTGEFFSSVDPRDANGSPALRDALNTLRVSDTSTEVHDRSQVLTGAAYNIFQAVFAAKKQEGLTPAQALSEAGKVMGTLQMRATDFTPEKNITLEDVGKAYLTMDKELLGGRFHDVMAQEFVKRGIFTAGSEAAWKAHQASVPALQLDPKNASATAVSQLVQGNLDKLGLDQRFGLTVQGQQTDRDGNTIVRVQLTDGRGAAAKKMDNEGVLVFRKDGTLADYQSALPAGVTLDKAASLLQRAKSLNVDKHGAPLSLITRPDGSVTARALVFQKTSQGTSITEFSIDKPQGGPLQFNLKNADRINPEAVAKRLPKGSVLVRPEDC